MEKELSILRQLDHDNITSYAFIADERSKISIVMDWAGEGLREHRNNSPGLYTEAAVRHMAYQLTSALLHCHQQVSRGGLRGVSRGGLRGNGMGWLGVNGTGWLGGIKTGWLGGNGMGWLGG